jgi:hypothetical protein
VGFVGGEWRGGAFFYNRSVANVNVTNVTNIYNRTVVNNFAVNRVSYNGGAGGLASRPTPGELAAAREQHLAASPMQQRHQEAARTNRAQFASVNHGRPDVAATGRPGEFRGAGVVSSTRAGGTVNPEVYRAGNRNPTNQYSGTHGPNPGGGGNHPFMTAHTNNPSNPGVQNQPGSHSAPPQSRSFNTSSGNHQPVEAHNRQAQQHGAKPSGEGQKHEPEPHGKQ